MRDRQDDTLETKSSDADSIVAPRSIGQVVLIWGVAILIPLMAWTFASPVGASPDEPEHIAYAWGLVTGQDVFEISPDCIPEWPICTSVTVPPGLVPDPICHRRLPQSAATCDEAGVITVKQTRDVRYPPPYYIIVGGAMRASIEMGIGNAAIVGRMVGALLTWSLLLPAFVLAWRRAPKLIPFIIVTLTPITMFVSGSISPSGTEIAGAIAASVGLVVFSRSAMLEPISLGTFLYGMAWLALSRPLGFLWAAPLLIFGVLYVREGREDQTWREVFRPLLPALVGSLVILVMALGWFGFAIGARSLEGGTGKTVPAPGVERLLAIPLRWGDMLWESVGVLGWLLTPLPTPVMLLIFGCIFMMLVLATINSESEMPKRRISLQFLATIVLGVTALMFQTKFLWQGRYVIPVLAAWLILWAGTSSGSMAGRLQKLSLTAWLGSSFSALWIASRYMYGLQIRSRYIVPNFSGGVQWIPPVGNAGIVLLGLAGMVSVPIAMWLTTAFAQAPQIEAED